MAFTVGAKNRTVLIAIPEAPQYFFNVTRTTGIYVVGHSTYSGSRQSIVSTFQRTTDRELLNSPEIEEFVTGLLAVILITLFSEIVQVLLLRTTRNTIVKNGVRAAYLLDEYSHMRNVWRRSTRGRSHGRLQAVFREESVLLSVFVLSVALLLFGADVFAVYITRNREFVSGMNEFNLRGMQPVGTTEGIANRIRFLTDERRCVLPIGKFERQKKHFQLAGCVEHLEGSRVKDDAEMDHTVQMESWYHDGGSDHNVSFGESWYGLSVRAMVYLETDQSMKRIMFSTSSGWEEDTRYLHNVTIHRAMEWTCNKDKFNIGCAEIVKDLKFLEEETVEREIMLWERDRNHIYVNATGLRSRYQVDLVKAEVALRRGMQFLTASSAVLEVSGLGRYEDSMTGDQSRGIEGLMSETGRHAGLVLVGMLMVGCAAVLLVLRMCLDPMAMAELAVRGGKRK